MRCPVISDGRVGHHGHILIASRLIAGVGDSAHSGYFRYKEKAPRNEPMLASDGATNSCLFQHPSGEAKPFSRDTEP